MELQGTATLITGGSRGLGAALGRALARRGARVVLVARDGAALDQVVNDIRAAGGEARALVADIADKEATYAIAGAAAALVGPIDLLVHNAATVGPTPLPPLLDTDCEELERVLAVNVVGPHRLTKAVAGSMALRGRGLIVQLTSDAASLPYAGWGAYGASKAALEQLGRVLAVELADSGVRVVNVDPGEMDTRMHAEAIPDANRSTLANPVDVAERLVALLAGAINSGARVELR